MRRTSALCAALPRFRALLPGCQSGTTAPDPAGGGGRSAASAPSATAGLEELSVRARPASSALQGTGSEEAFEPIAFGDSGGNAYAPDFFRGSAYDPDVPTPDELIGSRHADRLSHSEEIVDCFRAWADASPRVRLFRHGRTHEGRDLVHAVITSPANHERLDAILAGIALLHDPRGADAGELERIVAGSPAVAWLGYSIHGDETSGADASVAVGYHLIAGADAEITDLLDRLVIVIDPVMNPDGRERITSMVEQAAGNTASLDWIDMHRGRWPWGRGNHYLFDMNRDWMAGTQPETRARWRAVLRYHPQLFVDAHEMGSHDTFLFYPQEKPVNRNYPANHTAWQTRFAAGASQAFDRYGWSYYTREWADGWAPFYSDAWGSLSGATGILYEQARTLGSALMRASGKVLTYRESVHHQAVASLANLRTLAMHREEALRDYLETKQAAVSADAPGNDRLFVIEPGANRTREANLIGSLLGQGIEVFRADEDFRATDVIDRFARREDEHEFPAGSYLVPARQPMRGMVRAYLEFEARMDRDALLAEREDLERKGTTRIYDATSWSLPHAKDLACYWTDDVAVARTALASVPMPDGPAPADLPAAFAWIADGGDDASVAFACRAMEHGLAVHVADKPFTAAGRSFPRGSILVRRDENDGTPEAVRGRVSRAAEEARAAVDTVTTGRSPDDGPDLGGGHFRLLARPRVALLSNSPIAPDTYGHLWHHLDTRLGVPLALLDAQELGSYDLRRYNVLILPQDWGGLAGVLGPVAESLQAWVQGGGTLIACGSAAAALTKGELGLSQVVLRRHALEELAAYGVQAERERGSREIEIDEELVWNGPSPEGDDAEKDEEGDEPEPPAAPEEPSEDDDAWLRRFSPSGATLLGLVDESSWLTFGAGPELPVLFGGSFVYLSKSPVQTPVRLAEPEDLRLAGLLWPEARGRIANSAWLTRERKGSGQVILFAAMPAYRGYYEATGRLFGNAVVLGPGLGASQPIGW